MNAAPNARASDPVAQLDVVLRRAIAVALGDPGADVDPIIRPCERPEFGDFQVNAVMSLAKQIGEKPRDLAARIIEAAELDDIAEPPEIAGPGFINIRLKGEALAGLLGAMDDESLGVEADPSTYTVAVDLCGVNVAKQTHVGHLRSTIIGDALARIFERRGRTVHRENHLGDWGLPIAMVLLQLREAGTDLDALRLEDLDKAYRDAQLSARADAVGLDRARVWAGPHRIAELEEQNAGAMETVDTAKRTLVALQAGDVQLVADWRKLVDCTLNALYAVLEVLNVEIGPEHNRGESFYRERLPDVVDAFVRAGIGVEDQGAIVVRFEDPERRPLIIRKSDGGFLYATVDLAAVRFRVQELGADRLLYVVDKRQQDHFNDIFDAARLIGWDRHEDGSRAVMRHIPFGAVLGEDKRPLKTRSGENITLDSLLEEAVTRATAEVRSRAAAPSAPTHGLMDEELAAIGRAVGVGAVKYADLSNDLIRDYVFSFDRMIAFEGNTGPYLQYAHARICRILAKAEREESISPAEFATADLLVAEPPEKALALNLLRYGSVVADVTRTLEPHRLCNHLYGLADAFSVFYEKCPVLRAGTPELGLSRLRLCDLARRVLHDGLGLLGIDAPPRM